MNKFNSTFICLTAALLLTACQKSMWDSPGKNTGVGCRALLQDLPD